MGRLKHYVLSRRQRAKLLEVALCFGQHRDIVNLFLDTVNPGTLCPTDDIRVRRYLSELTGDLPIVRKDTKCYEVQASESEYMRGMRHIYDQHPLISVVISSDDFLEFKRNTSDDEDIYVNMLRCNRNYTKSLTFMLPHPIGNVFLYRWDSRQAAA
jgi:hypothetical protein